MSKSPEYLTCPNCEYDKVTVSDKECPNCGQYLELTPPPSQDKAQTAQVVGKAPSPPPPQKSTPPQPVENEPSPLRQEPQSTPAPPKPEIVCPACKTSNPGYAKFCRGCGADLQPAVESSQGIVCPKCQRANPGYAKYCEKCGVYLLTGKAPQPDRPFWVRLAPLALVPVCCIFLSAILLLIPTPPGIPGETTPVFTFTSTPLITPAPASEDSTASDTLSSTSTQTPTAPPLSPTPTGTSTPTQTSTPTSTFTPTELPTSTPTETRFPTWTPAPTSTPAPMITFSVKNLAAKKFTLHLVYATDPSIRYDLFVGASDTDAKSFSVLKGPYSYSYTVCNMTFNGTINLNQGTLLKIDQCP